MSDFSKIAKDYFKHHKVDVLFFTSDEQAFFNEEAAVSHASTLPKEERAVTKVERGVKAAQEESKSTEPSSEEKKDNAKADDKKGADKKAKENKGK